MFEDGCVKSRFYLQFIVLKYKMVNRFKKLFGGYSSIKKGIKGKEYKFLYSDKPIVFDPNQMISDLNRSENNLVPRRLDSSETFETLLSRFPTRDRIDFPSVICEFKTGGLNYSVSRYTSKFDNYPISHYIFEEEKVVKAVFCRIYDYGYLLNSFATIVEPNFKEEDETVSSWKWQTQNNVTLYLEKFGHTQLWCWEGQLKNW